jgi:site-specific DNA recombinase
LKRVVLYARLSVAAEESVSIERQIEACQKYAEARGWTVVHTAIDDGVSATKARPEARTGWREVLDLAIAYEAVIVWKVDRLARRVLDFLNADATLQSRGAALVAVEDPIDMSTAQGRAFATMLAVFGEMEAAAISARVTSATRHLKHSGRVAGGERPWPYALARNPGGAGYVLEPIAERADAIREAAADLIDGTISSAGVGRRWDATGLAPKGKGKRGSTTWSPSSVRNLLRNPTLYGATLYRGRPIRNADGSVRISDHAILDRPTFDRLQRALDGGTLGPQVPRDQTLLGGIVACGTCGAPMGAHRPKTRPADTWNYRCQNRECPRRTGTRIGLLDTYVTDKFLRSFGHLPAVSKVTTIDGPNPDDLAVLETDLLDVEDALQDTDDEQEAMSLIRRRKSLRADLARLQDSPTHERTTFEALDISTSDVWLDADTATRREYLLRAIDELTLDPGTPGRHGLDADRISLRWNV